MAPIVTLRNGFINHDDLMNSLKFFGLIEQLSSKSKGLNCFTLKIRGKSKFQEFLYRTAIGRTYYTRFVFCH